MNMNYMQDIIRSGVGEKATLIKRPYENNEFGDPVYKEDKEETYKFQTVVDNLDRAENEQESGDFIEGDIRFFVSEDTDLEFVNGDFIEYDGKSFNITAVNKSTLGQSGFHKEIIAENAESFENRRQNP